MKALYIPGDTQLIDVTRNESFPETLTAKYPTAITLELEEAVKQVKDAENKKYIKPWQQIDEENFDFLLNVLPPMNWQRFGSWEAFRLCEAMTSNLYITVFRIGNKFYKAIRDRKISYEDMKREIEG